MSNKPKHKFPQGNTIAKDSNNQKRKRLRKSPLRKTLAKLQELEPKALENIKKSVDGDSIDKNQLDTSKWLVQQLQAVSKSAMAEEVELNELRFKADAITEAESEEEEVEKEEDSPQKRFSLHVLPKNTDL